jgi:hypothetical protein
LTEAATRTGTDSGDDTPELGPQAETQSDPTRETHPDTQTSEAETRLAANRSRREARHIRNLESGWSSYLD